MMRCADAVFIASIMRGKSACILCGAMFHHVTQKMIVLLVLSYIVSENRIGGFLIGYIVYV